jgi:hypothetical protein
MDRRRLPRTYHQPVPEPIVLTPADLRTARAELALALVHELLDTPPPLPVKLRERLTTVHAKLGRLVQVLRQAEAGRPRPGG